MVLLVSQLCDFPALDYLQLFELHLVELNLCFYFFIAL